MYTDKGKKVTERLWKETVEELQVLGVHIERGAVHKNSKADFWTSARPTRTGVMACHDQ
jgi:hypothetical protein